MNGRFNIVEALEIDQSIHSVTFGEALCDTRLMLVHSTNEIVGHANIERAANAIGQYVNVIAACSHLPSLEYWVARSSRAMTMPFVAAAVPLVAPESASTAG